MTILETIPIFAQPGNYNNLTLFSFVITLISIFIGLIVYMDDCKIGEVIFTTITAISLVIFIIGLILMTTEPKIDTGRKQYIIRVNENTSINEIYDNYKIIDHTKYTDVYTVEELEND